MTHDGQITETINSLRRRDPQGAFAILEELQHGVTGQPISSCEMVRVVANCPKNAVTCCSNPQSPSPITEEYIGARRRTLRFGERACRPFRVVEFLKLKVSVGLLQSNP